MGLMESSVSRYCLFLLILLLSSAFSLVKSGDADHLLALKSSIDPLNSLPWNGSNFCEWKEVKECMNGRVSKLVLEYLNLNGSLDEKIINQFDQLRVLSFKGNSISGQIPNLSGLANLKSLFLNNNNFSGEFPASISGLHRLKVVVLAANQISGIIPDSLLNLSRLYVLYLQDNQFTGKIPPFNQPSLRFFNVSNNQLSGDIPATPSLIQFNFSSFSGNLDLCGEQIQNPCNKSTNNNGFIQSKSKSNRTKLIVIIAGTVGGFVLLSLSLILLWILCSGKTKKASTDKKNKGVVDTEVEERPEASNVFTGAGASDEENKESGFSWEGEGLGNLVFLGNGEEQMSYNLEELLKASAETLGRGTMGSTYKAVMESGFVVTVKRLKDSRYPRSPEFRRHMGLIGKLVHPNLVPVRAYFQAKEERLIVYDYFPNGSLFSLIHGSRTLGGGKPLHWTSCLKIAEDVATGLLYIHQNPGLTHGNIKSSNVLLGSDFESCLTDYGLTSLQDPDSIEESSATSLFYRAPECRDIRRPSAQQADVYSFGVLLLELLTGKTPFQDLVQQHGSDIPRWVKSVREEETDSGDEPISSNEASEEKLQALLTIAMACVSFVPENRPGIRDVLKMISNARAEAQVSSNSSDHSPGRWSDTVQSLPREEHLSI